MHTTQYCHKDQEKTSKKNYHTRPTSNGAASLVVSLRSWSYLVSRKMQNNNKKTSQRHGKKLQNFPTTITTTITTTRRTTNDDDVNDDQKNHKDCEC